MEARKQGSKVIRSDVDNEGADEVPGIARPVVGSALGGGNRKGNVHGEGENLNNRNKGIQAMGKYTEDKKRKICL
jgi:hypothetical protein